MTKEIRTKIEINASPEKIWTVLTHQENYPNWNPFIRKMEGKLSIGERLQVIIQMNNSSKMTFKPIVLELEENQVLTWKGKFLISGLFDGTHTFELIDNNNGKTTFKQSEIFEGILVRFFNLENTKKGFERMNERIKQQCEK
ncbi:SRPBCC domain-containing protein [Flagellimonas profundi]|uniref:SRPBCC domain-containing protein n=1 Tax=Flagellimonas profundi TaxID=2915620 RepID=A0ABS3FK55_9FLAO|nr:SRPBCC domain-containing protein [Allomuricauda profundi]MBO0343497.1 SRPBCC domain-containing protein [Allomuricauda profundi]